jgi:fructoselysine-6-P-deglycase FrlB-like protein
MKSRYELNLLGQARDVAAALAAPKPSWMKPPRGRKVFLVGVGTNDNASHMAAWLWSSAGLDARAVHGHDFTARPYRLGRGDLAVFLSHGGGSSYTVKAEAMARRAGAETVVVTASGSPWPGAPRRLETGRREDTRAYTHSYTTTMAWLMRWSGSPALLAPFKRVPASLRWGPAFPAVRPDTDLVLLGDGLREWVAREAALKVLETSYLRVRAYGLEEFLHGPNVSVGPGSLVVGYSAPGVRRWAAARAWLSGVGARFTEVAGSDWLAQVLWSQRFALACCKRLGQDPDALRGGDRRYAAAARRLKAAPL